MKHYNFSTAYFHPEMFDNNDVIVDNEIANDISDDWNYEKGKIIVTGFLHKDRMDIFVAEQDRDSDFAKAIFKYILDHKKHKFWSFNRKMERGNFKGMWDLDIPIAEIKPFKAKGFNKDRFYKELLANNVIPDSNVVDVFDGDSSRCIEHWERFQDTGKIEFMQDVVKHNMNCLLKESVIQKHKDFFLKNYNINERGWYDG